MSINEWTFDLVAKNLNSSSQAGFINEDDTRTLFGDTTSESITINDLGGDPQFASGDFNNDGYDDIAILGYHKIIAFYSNGFNEWTFDLVAKNLNSSSQARFIKSDDSEVLFSDTISESITINDLGGAPQLTSGDFNNDGYDDLAVMGYHTVLGFYSNGIDDWSVDLVANNLNGSSSAGFVNDDGSKTYFSETTSETTQINNLGGEPQLRSGDFNNDGYDDMAILGYHKVIALNAFKTTGPIDQNSDGENIFYSNALNQIFEATEQADVFMFENKDETIGIDEIIGFDSTLDKIELIDFQSDEVSYTLNKSGEEVIFLSGTNDRQSVVLQTNTAIDTLKIKNLSNIKLNIFDKNNHSVDSVEHSIGSSGELAIFNKTHIDYVSISDLEDISQRIVKKGDIEASDPINLSDVLAQLKHIVGLKPLKNNAFNAADVDNNGNIELVDVLQNLKHIVGLRKLNTFDLVSENQFKIDALGADSNGELSMIINGDADMSHADWMLL